MTKEGVDAIADLENAIQKIIKLSEPTEKKHFQIADGSPAYLDDDSLLMWIKHMIANARKEVFGESAVSK